MGNSSRTDEPHALRGAIDRPALITTRDLIDEVEPLASATLDEFLNPTALEVSLEDGLRGAESARLDIRWTTGDDYSFHYTDSRGINCRWDSHPHGGNYVRAAGLGQFHPPPEASSDPTDVEASCIVQSPERLVTRAVLKLWRTAYHADSFDPLNTGSNPPHPDQQDSRPGGVVRVCLRPIPRDLGLVGDPVGRSWLRGRRRNRFDALPGGHRIGPHVHQIS